MKFRRMLLGPALTVTLLLSMSLTLLQTPPVSAVFSGANGKIAFYSTRDGNEEIYVMNPDGSGQTNLTNNPARDLQPAWSPDGSKIAFASTRDGNTEIYVMNADGSGQTRLTNDPSNDQLAAWSPNGTKIAFASDRNGGKWAWYVINADGSGSTIQDQAGVFANWSAECRCSPDHSKQLGFSKTGAASMDIYLQNSDGSGETLLTGNAAWNNAPAWSPDGSKITFQSNRTGTWQVYVMNPDGSSQTQLTNNPGQGYDPDWQPITAGTAYTTGTTSQTFAAQSSVTTASQGSSHATTSGQMELAYDDGILAGYNRGFAGVLFSLPPGVGSARLLTIRVVWISPPLLIHITREDHLTEITAPITVAQVNRGEFTNVDVSNKDIVVTSDFFVILDPNGGDGNFGSDAHGDSGRSFFGGSLAGMTYPYDYGDVMIRVVVEPISSTTATLASMTTTISTATIGTATPTSVNAQTGHEFSAYATSPPQIDGQVQPGEWAMADSVSLQLTAGGVNYLVTLAIMNDLQNLYLLATVKGPPSFTGGSVVAYWFDNSNKGYRTTGDDYLSANKGWGLSDGFWNATTNNNPSDTDYGGTKDGSVGISFVDGTEIFELSHPLCSNDRAHDFCVQPDRTLGFFMTLSMDKNHSAIWPDHGFAGILVLAAPTTQTGTATMTPQSFTQTGESLLGMIQQNGLLIIGILAVVIILLAVIVLRRPKAAYPSRPPLATQPPPAAYQAPTPKPSSIFCTQCGAENPPTHKFCEKCGQKLLLPSP